VRACMAQAVPRVKAPRPNLGRPAQAGAVFGDGVSSAVELALVMADAEWGVRRRTAGTDRRWSAGSLPNLRPARGTTAPCLIIIPPWLQEQRLM
jgi:hypothetical protein